MKNIILSCLAICVAVAWGGNILLSSPTPSSCAILDKNWNLWDVNSTYFNTTDSAADGTRNWPLSVNLCLDMERGCAHTTNEPCSVCQYVPDSTNTNVDSYCLGYSKDEVYTPLDQSQFPGVKGFTAMMSGDNDWCPGGISRFTYINVLCKQPFNGIQYIGEAPTCTYSFNLSLTQDCSISAASFTPTFTITSVTPNAFTVTIDDGYPFEFWNYNVKVNGKYGYQGVHRDIQIVNLDPGTTYNVVVERDSGDGAILNIISPSVALSVTTLAANLGSNTGSANTTPVTVTTSGTGTGVLLGLVIAFAFIVVIVGFLKLRGSEWWADKFGGSGSHRGGKGTFSLLDAEKSTAFDS